MLAEIAELGFHRVELSHGIPVFLVPGIVRAREEGWIEIGSVHNFCPLPSGLRHPAPNLFEPSTRRAIERTMWLRSSRRTFEFARQVGAGRVVMHSGSVHFVLRSPERILDRPPAETDAAAREKALQRLRRKAGAATERVRRNYEDLLPDAESFEVELGLENREGVLELPLDDDMASFLSGFPDSAPVGYWHDTGHAQIKQELALLDHRTHLEGLSDRLVGFHLHDVSPEGRDHQQPGTGRVDFGMIREFVRPHHTLVAELSPRLTREEVLHSRDFLLQRLG